VYGDCRNVRFADKFRKIVVTDDAGRFVVPICRRPTTKCGLGLRSRGLRGVSTTLGKTLALKAVIAPTPQARRKYTGDYWFSLINMPPRAPFHEDTVARWPANRRRTGLRRATSLHEGYEIENQAHYAFLLKRGCEVCHQMGERLLA